jgi:hypothetical protein
MVKDKTKIGDAMMAGICKPAGMDDETGIKGRFTFTCWRVRPELLVFFEDTKQQFDKAIAEGKWAFADLLQKTMDSCRAVEWSESLNNTVTTEGRNALLTAGLKGSGYTAAVYVGLISAASYVSAPAVGDTMASHANWKEAGTTYAPTFAARVAATFGTASAGSLATSASSNFTMTGIGTIKGAKISFSGANSTILNTTGALYAAGLFTQDKNVEVGDVIQVSYSTTLT